MANIAELIGDMPQDAAGNAACDAAWLTLSNIEKSAFVAQWDDLAANAEEPNAFYESWYLLPSLRAFGSDVSIFSVHIGGLLVGLLPVQASSQYGRWPVPHAQNWRHPNIFLGTPLVRKGNAAAFWQALLAEFDQNAKKSLFLHINGMSTDGPLAAALEQLSGEQGRRMGLVQEEDRAFLQSDLSPEEYYTASMRGKKRKELRRQKNRLSETGNLVFSRGDGSGSLQSWVDEFLALERQGWKGAQGSALDCADETRQLFLDALAGAAERGRLELLDLRLDGKPLAMLANFLSAPGSFSFKTTFDEEYSRFSPGVLLQIENLALLERDGTDWCDSCAVEGHPMIDSVWTGRRCVGRYSIAIGGAVRRAMFGAYLGAELARARGRQKHGEQNEAQTGAAK